MANVIKRPGWRIPEREVTSESTYKNRREFLKTLGYSGTGLAAATLVGCSPSAPIEMAQTQDLDVYNIGYPHPRNEAFNPDWKLTDKRQGPTITSSNSLP